MKCFPTSRMNSTALSGSSHSALSRMSAPRGPGAKSRKRESCSRIASEFARTTSGVFSWRSAVFPLGSPIIPVPPPTSATGRCPCRCRCASAITGTRFPTCRLGAVGSKPQYAVTTPAPSAAAQRLRLLVEQPAPRAAPRAPPAFRSCDKHRLHVAAAVISRRRRRRSH